MFRRFWIFFCAAAALAGCADIPQSHDYALLSDRMEEQSQFLRYRDDLDSGDFAPLHGKVNFAETYYPNVPVCQPLAADRYPTPAESAALRHWAALRAAYFEHFYANELKLAALSETVAPLAQRYVAALQDDLDYSTALIDDLAAGKMSYCDFATRQKAATIASADRAKPLRREMVAAMIDDYYFDGTGLSRHPGKVRAGSTGLLQPGSFGLPLGHSNGWIRNDPQQAEK